MADVFDFNEGDEDCWSSDSPHKALQSPFSLRPAALQPEARSSSQPAATASTTPPGNISKPARRTSEPARRTSTNPLVAGGRRTRHARKRQAEELEKKEKQAAKRRANEEEEQLEEVLAKKAKRTKKQNKSEADDDTDDDASIVSLSKKQQQSSLKVKSIAPRRRRRRKQTNSGLSRPLIARRSASSGITDSLSPPFGGANSSKSSFGSPPSATSISQQIQRKLQQHERQQNKLCPEPSVVVSRKIKGAGRNVFAVQDAGNHQMIHDECAELTSTILACPKDKILARGIIVETVSELALMLSSTKTRRILWQHSEDDNLVAKGTTLAGILDVLLHTTTALSEKQSKHDNQRWLPLLQKLQPTKRSHKSRRHPCVQQQQENIVENYYMGLLLDSLVAVVSFLSWDTTVDHKDSVHHKNSKGARALRRAILEHEGVLRAIMHLIRHADPMVPSILDAQAVIVSANLSATAAKTERVDDASEATPHASNSSAAKLYKGLGDLPKSALNYNTSNESQEEPLGFSKSSDLSSGNRYVGGGTTDSQESVVSASSQNTGDPTVAGRRKRRRRKAPLEPIAEDVLSFNGDGDGVGPSSPKSPPRVVFKQQQQQNEESNTRLSLQDSPSKLARPRPSRNTSHQDAAATDDGSSMVSCDSALLKVHDHLSKARAKFILPPLQEPTRQHQCQTYRELHLSFGGKDPAGAASMMAARALHRLLEGKDEADSHSCLDDEVDEESSDREQGRDLIMSDEDDDDAKPKNCNANGNANDLQRSNPLLQTNMLIGNSGMIPLLARGMAETLSAFMEELNASNPCPGCLQHLHDKFRALVPIVDNACCLHSANRADFCAASLLATNEDDDDDDDESDDSVQLIGCLVLFLKHWTGQKVLPINGKKTKQALMMTSEEVAWGALRTLASLSHDNVLSTEQFAIRYRESLVGNHHHDHRTSTPPPKSPSSSTSSSLSCWNSVQVLCRVLRKASSSDMDSNKIAFDTRTFCLNTLTNVVGEDTDGEIRRILLAMKWPNEDNGKGSVDFLTGLTQWVVSQTDRFRDSIMKEDFGAPTQQQQQNEQPQQQQQQQTNQQHPVVRDFEVREEERLATAGSGCVFLACLLRDPTAGRRGGAIAPNATRTSLADVVQKIREMILSEMPLDDESGLPSGTTFLKNTLRAFSNLLYCRVGELSVALVAPISKLIRELGNFQVEVVS